MAKADNIFIENCKNILENGEWDYDIIPRPKWKDGTPAHSIRAFGIVNRYNLEEEFPALTIRKLQFKNCIDEILWIWQKKSNNVNNLNSNIWDEWASSDGSIGKSYGYQLGIKHRYSEGEFDQVDRILFDLKNNPKNRRIISNMYNHNDLYDMNLYPCAYSLTLGVKNGRLNGILNQRSQDFLMANNWNVCQYSILIHMFSHIFGYKAGELIHVIADAHIYDRHIDIIKNIIDKNPKKAPKLNINTEIKDFYDFKIDDFSLSEYSFHNLGIKIPIAV